MELGALGYPCVFARTGPHPAFLPIPPTYLHSTTTDATSNRHLPYVVTDITDSTDHCVCSETLFRFLSVQDLKNVVLPLEDGSELCNSRMTMKYHSRLTGTHKFNDLWGGSAHM